MIERLKKEEFVRLLAARMKADEAMATAWVDGVVETLYESFKAGQSVTLPGFGGFYVRPESGSWVFKFNPGQRLRAVWLVIDLHRNTLDTSARQGELGCQEKSIRGRCTHAKHRRLLSPKR